MKFIKIAKNGIFQTPKEKIPGGISSGMRPEDFRQEDLEEGIKIEMEHTSDKNIAREIAMDHLKEDPDYYRKLKKMEAKG